MRRKCFYCGKRKKTKRIKVNFWQDWDHYQCEFFEFRDYFFSYHDECLKKSGLDKSDPMWKKYMIGAIIETRIAKDIITERKKSETGPWCEFCDKPAIKTMSWPTHPTAWEFHVFSQHAAYHDECLRAELEKEEDWSRVHEWAKCIRAEIDGESFYDSKKSHIKIAAEYEYKMADKESKMWASIGRN